MDKNIQKPVLPTSQNTFLPIKRRFRNKTEVSITIGTLPERVYSFWRNFENLPKFMKDLTRIEVLSPTLTRWHIETKSGIKVAWDATIFEDKPGEFISWESDTKSPVQTAGTIWFELAPGGRGTIVSLNMYYKIPGNKLTEVAAMLTGEDPKDLVLTNLKRLKALLETGEIPTTEGQPSGRDKDSEFASKASLH